MEDLDLLLQSDRFVARLSCSLMNAGISPEHSIRCVFIKHLILFDAPLVEQTISAKQLSQSVASHHFHERTFSISNFILCFLLSN